MKANNTFSCPSCGKTHASERLVTMCRLGVLKPDIASHESFDIYETAEHQKAEQAK